MDTLHDVATNAFGVGWLLSGAYLLFVAWLIAGYCRSDVWPVLAIVLWLLIAAIAFI